jgi:hypothetical protein
MVTITKNGYHYLERPNPLKTILVAVLGFGSYFSPFDGKQGHEL